MYTDYESALIGGEKFGAHLAQGILKIQHGIAGAGGRGRFQGLAVAAEVIAAVEGKAVRAVAAVGGDVRYPETAGHFFGLQLK